VSPDADLEKHGIDFEQAFGVVVAGPKVSTAQIFQLIQLARTEIYRKGRDQTGVRRTLENHIPLGRLSQAGTATYRFENPQQSNRNALTPHCSVIP
jgi:hypothetical protein